MQAKNTIKLNIGAGNTPLPGYTSVDIDPEDGDEQATAWDLLYEDNTVDAIYSRHMIEHVGYKDALRCLAEWYRVLVPGGTVRIICPDRDYHYQFVGNYTLNPKTGISFHEHAMFSLYGWQRGEHDYHKWAWSWRELLSAMRDAGFGWLSQNPDTTDVDIKGSK